MPIRVFSILVFSTAVIGCADPDVTVSVSFPWLLQAEVACESDNLEGMQASLHVAGGYPPCDLEVAADLAVSGTCPGIRTGSVRPLLILYAIPIAGVEVHLAYAIGWADLSFDELPDAQKGKEPVVSVVLTKDDVIYREPDMVQLAPDPRAPDYGCDQKKTGSAGQRARVWAFCHLKDKDSKYIENAPGSLWCSDPHAQPPASNLDRVCSGELEECLPYKE